MLAAKQLFSIVALSAFLTVASAQATAECSRNGTVQLGDDCDSFAVSHDTSHFQIAYFNPHVNCDYLVAGDELCVGKIGEDCQDIVSVGEHDTCRSITTDAGITEYILFSNNPNIDGGCSNIYFGEVLCVADYMITYYSINE